MNKKLKFLKFFYSIVIIFILLSQNIVVDAAKKKSDTTPPAAPTNLIAATVGETSVTLKWTASYDKKGVASYLIYKDSVYISSSKTTSYTVTGLTASDSYDFYVIAKDYNGNISPLSNTISVTTLTPPPVTSTPKIIAGYYASWSAYSGYTPLNIPASKLTHINYAFAVIGDDLKIALGDPYIDIANFYKAK